jgi:hypothetical protein
MRKKFCLPEEEEKTVAMPSRVSGVGLDALSFGEHLPGKSGDNLREQRRNNQHDSHNPDERQHSFDDSERIMFTKFAGRFLSRSVVLNP